MKYVFEAEQATRDWGEKLGRLISGGTVIELVGDIGAGKTTLTKGIARGLEVTEDIQSPTFTLSRVYECRDDLTLYHYDFYRLNDAGVMAAEIDEAVHDESAVVVIEWSDIVQDVLPEDRLRIELTSPSETTRELKVTGPDALLERLS